MTNISLVPPMVVKEIEVITPPKPSVIEIVVKGPQGPKGDSGPVDESIISALHSHVMSSRPHIPAESGFDAAAFFNAMII